MIRSAINGIVPKRDLVGYRYGFHPNCDVREALNFFGTTNSRQFKFNLDLACKAFGVETSKSEGIDGRSVETWYRAGRHREIADYCLEDVRATAELYEKIAASLLMFNREFRESEERAARRAPTEQAELPIMLPRSEQTFMDAIERSSIDLSEALERTEVVEEKVTSKHQVIILDKLVQDERPEEEIPTGI